MLKSVSGEVMPAQVSKVVMLPGGSRLAPRSRIANGPLRRGPGAEHLNRRHGRQAAAGMYETQRGCRMDMEGGAALHMS